QAQHIACSPFAGSPEQQADGLLFCSGLSSLIQYHSHFNPWGSLAQILSWVAWQHTTPSSTASSMPLAANRSPAASTSAGENTSTPRWFSRPAARGFSNNTSFSGGESMAKFA